MPALQGVPERRRPIGSHTQGKLRMTQRLAPRNALAHSLIATSALSLLSNSSQAAEDRGQRPEVLEEVIIVEDRLEVLPTTPVDSVFGFGKSALETPRAVTS